MKLDQLNHKNALSSFTRDFLVENIEKKRPHMLKAIEKHLDSSLLPPSMRPDPNDVVDHIAQTDPVAVKSKGKKTPFVNDIMRWWIGNTIALPEDIDTTREALEIYLKAKQSGPVDSMSEFDNPGAIRMEYADAETDSDKYSNAAELVDTIGEYKLYRIDNYEQGAICFKDSGWCVQQEEYFNDYRPPFFMVNKGKKRYALLHNAPDDSTVGEHGSEGTPSYDMMDVHDNPITVEMAKPIQKWMLQLWPDFALPLWDMIELYPAEKIENLLFSGDVDPVYLTSYAKHQKGGRWKEFEDFLMNGEYDASAILHYCKMVLEGRWPQAEQLMLNHKYDADDKGKDLIQYAHHIIKGRWQEAERYMHTAGGMFDYYKKKVLEQDPDAEFEDITAASVLGMTDDDFAVKLAKSKQ